MNEPETLIGQLYTDLVACCAVGADMPAPEQVADQSYVSIPASGISLVLPDNERVDVVQLHGQGREDFEQYFGPMPGGISFSMTRREVLAILGPARTSGERQVLPIFGEKPAWDSFVVAGIRVHVEYSLAEDTVGLVSLTQA